MSLLRMDARIGVDDVSKLSVQHVIRAEKPPAPPLARVEPRPMIHRDRGPVWGPWGMQDDVVEEEVHTSLYRERLRLRQREWSAVERALAQNTRDLLISQSLGKSPEKVRERLAAMPAAPPQPVELPAPCALSTDAFDMFASAGTLGEGGSFKRSKAEVTRTARSGSVCVGSSPASMRATLARSGSFSLPRKGSFFNSPGPVNANGAGLSSPGIGSPGGANLGAGLGSPGVCSPSIVSPGLEGAGSPTAPRPSGVGSPMPLRPPGMAPNASSAASFTRPHGSSPVGERPGERAAASFPRRLSHNVGPMAPLVETADLQAKRPPHVQTGSSVASGIPAPIAPAKQPLRKKKAERKPATRLEVIDGWQNASQLRTTARASLLQSDTLRSRGTLQRRDAASHTLKEEQRPFLLSPRRAADAVQPATTGAGGAREARGVYGRRSMQTSKSSPDINQRGGGGGAGAQQPGESTRVAALRAALGTPSAPFGPL